MPQIYHPGVARQAPRISPLRALRTPSTQLRRHVLVDGTDVEVARAAQSVTVGATTYPAGSYVIDIRQPKRGLANTMLERGWDISDLVPQMYDISGWSHSLLWGATVVRVEEGTPLRASTVPVSGTQRARGGVEGGQAAAYAFELDDVPAVQAVNALLDRGARLRRAPDGRVIAPASAKQALLTEAVPRGVDVAALGSLPAGAGALREPRVAVASPGDEQLVLRDLGFDIAPVSTAVLNSGFDLTPHDVLFVSSGLSYPALTVAAKAEVQDFLAHGGGLVTRGLSGATFNQQAGGIAAGINRGPADANGIALVERAPGAPSVAGHEAGGTSFVFSPLWFTALGSGVTADERYASGDFFVAGHWIGQAAASGQASVVSGAGDTGERAVLFGTEPMFRDHPKGLYPQVANALYWVASD
jgi:hypothetical protein